MSSLQPRQDFSPSCPNGGSWYSCGYGSRFVGCCRSEACANDCPAGNLEAASFDPSFYGTFPDQNCGSGEWYSCNTTTPPFLGCCKINACNTTSGCPEEDLGAGFLSNNPTVAAEFSPTGGPSSTATVTSSSLLAATGTENPTSSGSTAAAHSNSVSVGAIVGGVVGGICALAILAGILFYMRRRKNRKEPQELQASELPPELVTGKAGGVSELASNQSPYSPSLPSYSRISSPASELPADHKIPPPSELSGNDVHPIAELEGSSMSSFSSRRSSRRWTGESWLEAKNRNPQGPGLGINLSQRSPKAPKSPPPTPLSLREQSIREDDEISAAPFSPQVSSLSPRGSSRFRESFTPEAPSSPRPKPAPNEAQQTRT